MVASKLRALLAMGTPTGGADLVALAQFLSDVPITLKASSGVDSGLIW
jgi:hypothetical protein